MFHKLRVQFGGIVCFAVRGEAAPEKVLALLADARNPTGGGHHGGSHHPPHVSVLQFFVDQLSPKNALEPDLRFRLPGCSREQAVVFLTREDLEVAGTEGLAPTVLSKGRSNDTRPENEVEEHDFHWVADVAKLGVTTLLDGCVDPAQPAPDGLLARFTLRGGVLTTGRVETGGGFPLEATFIDDNNVPLAGYRQALALWSDWDLPVPDGDIEIRLTPFGAGQPRSLVLSSRGLPSGSTLAIAIKNVSMADLFEVASVIQPDANPGEAGGHFDLHYALASPKPETTYKPDLPIVTDGKPICPPSMLRV